MNRVRRFFYLSQPDRRLLAEAALLLLLARFALRFLPFRIVIRLVELASMNRRREMPSTDSPGRVGWAVTRARDCVPLFATCLTQALAAQVLMQRRGYPARLCMGVRKSNAGVFQAHAWLDWQGQIVIGGSDVALFTAFPLHRWHGVLPSGR